MESIGRVWVWKILLLWSHFIPYIYNFLGKMRLMNRNEENINIYTETLQKKELDG